jgi:Lon-like protease
MGLKRKRKRLDPPFQPPPELGPDGEPLPRRRSVFRAFVAPMLGLVAVAAVVASLVIKSDKVAYVAGSASDVFPRVSISGQKDYPPKGRIMLATVGITGRLTWFQAFQGWLEPDTDVYDYEYVFPRGRTSELKEARVQMDDSKLVATLVALRAIGENGTGSGVRVAELGKGMPAQGKINVGDVILTIGGADICIASDLRAGIKATKPDQPVTLIVKRAKGGPTETVEVMPRVIQGERRLGVVVETVNCKLPVEVTIDTDTIGGPSAGLSMTLAIIDRLTPGDLTGGAIVAATGTIDGDGTVGDVGGVKQKTAGVISSGAKLFLVPPGEEREARARAGKLPVVAVRNLSEALAALRQYGGQPLPSPRATP